MHVHSGVIESTTLYVLHVEATLAFWSAGQFSRTLIICLLLHDKGQVVCP